MTLSAPPPESLSLGAVACCGRLGWLAREPRGSLTPPPKHYHILFSLVIGLRTSCLCREPFTHRAVFQPSEPFIYIQDILFFFFLSDVICHCLPPSRGCVLSADADVCRELLLMLMKSISSAFRARPCVAHPAAQGDPEILILLPPTPKHRA